MNIFREHSRDYPFRPPRTAETANAQHTQRLFARFWREYLWRHRWKLLLTVLLIGINANYSYVVSALSRVVVDKVLVIGSESPAPELQPKPLTQRDRAPARRNVPQEGLGRKIDRGFRVNLRPPEAGRMLLWIGIAYVLTQIFFNWLGRASTNRLISLCQSVLGSMRENMHRKVLELSTNYHQTMSSGRLLSRILGDTNAAQAELNSLIINGIGAATMLTAGVIITLCNDWRMGILLAVCLPLYGIMLKRSVPGIQYLQQEQRHTNSCIYGLVAQKFDAVKAIQSYHREKGEELTMHRLNSCFMRDAVRVQFICLSMNCKTQLIAHLCNCTVFLYGGWLVMNGEMTLGKMLFLQSMTLLLFEPVDTLTWMIFCWQSLSVALGRCYTVLDEKPEIADAPDAVDFPQPLKRGVSIEHLSFRYPERLNRDGSPASEKNALVLDDVSLFVPAGSSLCIMGASGCGKSTLLHLLARLYQPENGRILFDDTDLDKVRITSLRQSIGVVPQEAQIFSGTIRDNIAYGRPNASNADIVRVAKQAQMHDFIIGMPVKYETLIGEKGQSLSGGQRQRLSLARALLTNPEVLLLDDCTSALDANTERRIQETLENSLQGKTAIMVSQRVSMAIRCSQIAVIADGKISELGTHQELVARDGFYAKLVREQTGK